MVEEFGNRLGERLMTQLSTMGLAQLSAQQSAAPQLAAPQPAGQRSAAPLPAPRFELSVTQGHLSSQELPSASTFIALKAGNGTDDAWNQWQHHQSWDHWNSNQHSD